MQNHQENANKLKPVAFKSTRHQDHMGLDPNKARPIQLNKIQFDNINLCNTTKC